MYTGIESTIICLLIDQGLFSDQYNVFHKYEDKLNVVLNCNTLNVYLPFFFDSTFIILHSKEIKI